MRIKKLITGIVMAAFLTFAVAGQAMAYFEDDHLTMFFYTEGGTEVGYDLGAAASMDFTLSNQVLAPAGTFDFLAETGAGALSDVNVGIYTGIPAPTYDAWFVTTLADTEPPINTNLVSSFWNAIGNIRGIYGTENQKVSGAYGDPGSYGEMMGASGSYAAFHAGDISTGELNLADAGGINDLYLYHFVATGPGAFALDSGATTAHKAVLDIGLDGSVTMNPVPIPGAVWLLGSGLLGLVGIRRRKLA